MPQNEHILHSLRSSSWPPGPFSGFTSLDKIWAKSISIPRDVSLSWANPITQVVKPKTNTSLPRSCWRSWGTLYLPQQNKKTTGCQMNSTSTTQQPLYSMCFMPSTTGDQFLIKISTASKKIKKNEKKKRSVILWRKRACASWQHAISFGFISGKESPSSPHSWEFCKLSGIRRTLTEHRNIIYNTALLPGPFKLTVVGTGEEEKVLSAVIC